jgi:hypothetical protein
MMRKIFSMIFFIILTNSLFLQGCANTEKKKARQPPEGRLYNKPYDEVWDAVQELIFIDMRCIEKKMEKNKGTIETTWVVLITTEGTQRWRIKAEVKEKKDGTFVEIDKDIQILEEVRKSLGRPDEDKKKDDLGRDPWRSGDLDIQTLGDMYQQLDKKLQ